MSAEKKIEPFEIMDCALITLATGKRAMNLRELRDRIADIEEQSLHYHFYENLLRPEFDDPEFRNDFAVWAKRALHDTRLAEKIGTLDPLACCGLDDLRTRLLDVIEDHLFEREYVPWAKPDQEFHFLTSRVVVFDTHKRCKDAEELGKAVRKMNTGSIFFHFIDARRRPPLNVDDFTTWLEKFGKDTKELREELAALDYYFWTLPETRDRIAETFQEVLGKGRAA